jgi:cytoskeletal protein CcmA (bactofilin family)
VAIFGKSDNLQGQPPAPDRVPGAPPAPVSPGTVIGPKARLTGEISGDEDILIHGRFEGNIKVQRRVTVAASGEVKGDVQARTVVVGGRVHGQIRAEERAELLASASVQGNVNAPKVVIAEGAQLQGNVAMSTPAAASPAPVQQKAEES